MTTNTTNRHNNLGDELCNGCYATPHNGPCDPHDIAVEKVRAIVALSIAQRRDALTTARLITKAVGL